MSKSNMQHQREQDDAAEIENMARALKIEMKDALAINHYFEMTGGRDALIFDRDNVIDVMIDLDSEGFNWAVVSQDAVILAELKARAIEDIVGNAAHKLRRMAEWEFNKKDEAA